MEARLEENKFGYISRWVIYDGPVQVADVHCTIPNVFDSINGDDWLPDDEIEKYAHLLASSDSLKQRAESAEARAADLAESNRELSESVKTLRAERDDQATRIIELEATTAAYKIGNDELKRIIDTLRSERNEAWSSLKETRDTIQDLTL